MLSYLTFFTFLSLLVILQLEFTFVELQHRIFFKHDFYFLFVSFKFNESYF